jgi:hypothetical protein
MDERIGHFAADFWVVAVGEFASVRKFVYGGET